MYKVSDVTCFSLEGFPSKTFETLVEAFNHVATEIEMGYGNRYEIQDLDDDNLMNTIEVDARSFEG
jgi:hypothetical protein